MGQRERHRMNLDRTGMAENCDPRCYTQTINCTDNPPCENNMRLGKINYLNNSLKIYQFLKL